MNIGTRIHWLAGPWAGKLGLSARPRGGDWLEDEIAAWKQAGVQTVLSLLTPEEEEELGLRREAQLVRGQGMNFRSLPIPDRQVPVSESEITAVLETLNADLASGRNVLIHCRQGLGRSGLVASCLLITRGLSPGAAIHDVSAARGAMIPETEEQRNWIEHYAAVLAGAK